MLKGVYKRRLRSAIMIQGHAIEQYIIDSIIKLLRSSELTYPQIARRFDVSVFFVRKINDQHHIRRYSSRSNMVWTVDGVTVDVRMS